MNTHFRRTALLLFALIAYSFSQPSQHGTIVFRSTPSQVDVYSPQYGYIGTTPFNFTLRNPIPVDALESGVWKLGPFTARKNDSAPIILYPKLEITDDIRGQYTSQSNFTCCWIFTFPFCHENLAVQTEPVATAPDFFACNHWVDKNQDGAVAPDEWHGIKEYFRPNEIVTFVAYINKGVGVDFEYELRDPNNNTPDLAMLPSAPNLNTPTSGSGTTKFNNSVIRIEFAVKDLLGCPTFEGPESPAGDWNVYWKVQGDLVNITKVRLK